MLPATAGSGLGSSQHVCLQPRQIVHSMQHRCAHGPVPVPLCRHRLPGHGLRFDGCKQAANRGFHFEVLPRQLE